MTKLEKVLATFAAIGILSIAVASGAALYQATHQRPVVAPRVGYSGWNSFSTATNTTTTISSTGSQILALNQNRQYAVIVNDGSNTVYLWLKATSTGITPAGIRLNANGGSFEIGGQNTYLGAVQGVTLTGTSSLTVVEGP